MWSLGKNDNVSMLVVNFRARQGYAGSAVERGFQLDFGFQPNGPEQS